MYVNHAGDPALEIGDNDWDDLEPLANAAAVAAYGWVENVSVADLVKTSRTLATYVDFARIAGPRGLDAQRMAAGGQLRFACATTPASNGGQLGAAIETHLGTQQAAGTGMAFLGKELPRVLEATQWEYPFQGALPSMSDYALELPSRASWGTAGQQDGPPLVMHRIVKAIGEFDVLPVLLHSVMRRPTDINTQLAQVGPAVLGKKANYLKQLEAALLEDYESTIKQGQAAGDSTQDLLKKIVPLGQTFRPRDIIQQSNEGLMETRAVLEIAADTLGGRFAKQAASLRGYADAIQPLDVAEAPNDLLDQDIILNHDLLEKELSSEPLPVYELPWSQI